VKRFLFVLYLHYNQNSQYMLYTKHTVLYVLTKRVWFLMGPRRCGSVFLAVFDAHSFKYNIICYLSYEWKTIGICCAERQTDEKMRTVSNLIKRRWWITMNGAMFL